MKLKKPKLNKQPSELPNMSVLNVPQMKAIRGGYGDDEYCDYDYDYDYDCDYGCSGASITCWCCGVTSIVTVGSFVSDIRVGNRLYDGWRCKCSAVTLFAESGRDRYLA